MSLRFKSIADIPAHLLRQRSAPIEPVAQPKRRKYRNVPVEIDGQRFDSKLEGRCYEWLKLRRQAQDVRWFIRQVPFRLPGGVVYRADFLAVTRDRVEVIDAKGKDTRESINKRKQVLELYGVDVMLWRDAA